MSDARQMAEWTRTSWLLAKLHNVHAAKRQSIRKPEDFNPMLRRRAGVRKLDRKSSMSALKAAFVKQETRKERRR